MTTKQDLFMERMKAVDSKIRAYARFFAFKSQGVLDADDLFQISMMDLYKRYCIEPEFLDNNDSYISCYASWMQKNALLHESSLYARRVADLNPEFCEVPYLQGYVVRPEPQAVRAEVFEIARQLPELYQDIFTMLVEGYDLEKIGAALGLSKYQASRRKQDMIHVISRAYSLPRDRRQLMIREMHQR